MYHFNNGIPVQYSLISGLPSTLFQTALTPHLATQQINMPAYYHQEALPTLTNDPTTLLSKRLSPYELSDNLEKKSKLTSNSSVADNVPNSKKSSLEISRTPVKPGHPILLENNTIKKEAGIYYFSEPSMIGNNYLSQQFAQNNYWSFECGNAYDGGNFVYQNSITNTSSSFVQMLEPSVQIVQMPIVMNGLNIQSFPVDQTNVISMMGFPEVQTVQLQAPQFYYTPQSNLSFQYPVTQQIYVSVENLERNSGYQPQNLIHTTSCHVAKEQGLQLSLKENPQESKDKCLLAKSHAPEELINIKIKSPKVKTTEEIKVHQVKLSKPDVNSTAKIGDGFHSSNILRKTFDIGKAHSLSVKEGNIKVEKTVKQNKAYKKKKDELFELAPVPSLKKLGCRKKNLWQLKQEEKMKMQIPQVGVNLGIRGESIIKNKDVRIGAQYQAEILEFCLDEEDMPRRKPTLKWDPKVISEECFTTLCQNLEDSLQILVDKRKVIEMLLENENKPEKILEMVQSNPNKYQVFLVYEEQLKN